MDYSFFKHLEKPEGKIKDENYARNKLVELLWESVKSLVFGSEEYPIAFSGGLDSSILAYLVSKYTKPVLYCAGFKNSYDIANAKKSAKLLGKELNIVLLDDLDLKEYSRKTIEIIGTDNKLQVELALPLLVLCENMKEKGYKFLMTGQGADTLFGGFDKYLRSADVEDDIYKAVANIYESNLKRDLSIGKYCNVELSFPFLSEKMVRFALEIPAGLKIKDSIRKYILRESFRGILPDKILDQNKKALQYGSGVHKALNKKRDA